jgi:hypothetical protein
MANLLPADEKITKVTPRDQVPTFHNFFSPLSYLPIGYDSKGSYIPAATSNSYKASQPAHVTRNRRQTSTKIGRRLAALW